MTIMGEGSAAADPKIEQTEQPVVQSEAPIEEKKPENIFSENNLSAESVLQSENAEKEKMLTITSEEKVAFIDSVVTNERFTKDYSLFGGKITLTVRSLTTEEVNALSDYILRNGSSDTQGLLSGKYRKYLAAAQIAVYNGTHMNPLEQPLFTTLEKNGKTAVPPGWIERSAYWDNLPAGLFESIMACIKDFDERYSLLCRKAEDANFWNPDTL